MGVTTVSDFVIWTKHIHDDAPLAAAVAAMSAGETVTLCVDGQDGVWRKMDDGKDGRPTQGIRPVGAAQQHWRGLYRERRGAVVSLEMAGKATGLTETATPMFDGGRAVRRLVRADAERSAALAALLDGAAQGWRSDGEAMTRDEMHKR
jgi:hypothetical protein